MDDAIGSVPAELPLDPIGFGSGHLERGLDDLCVFAIDENLARPTERRETSPSWIRVGRHLSSAQNRRE